MALSQNGGFFRMSSWEDTTVYILYLKYNILRRDFSFVFLVAQFTFDTFVVNQALLDCDQVYLYSSQKNKSIWLSNYTFFKKLTHTATKTFTCFISIFSTLNSNLYKVPKAKRKIIMVWVLHWAISSIFIFLKLFYH